MKNLKFLCLLSILLLTYSCKDKPADRTVNLTEPLPCTAWDTSAWISVADAPIVEGEAKDGMRAADGASWFVSDVANQGEVASMRWMTTGLGIYQLYINGQLIGDEILKPGFTHNAKTRRAYTYDVTNAIDRQPDATNQFAVEVTPGWWADKIVTPWGHEGFVGKKCAFRGVLEIKYTDGTIQYLGTDTDNWKAGIAGNVKHAAIYDGEIYDAREKPGYASIENYNTPEINEEFQGEILPTNGAEVYLRHDLALEPIKAYVWENVVDVTDDNYGKIVIKREYDKGQPMELKAGEKLVIDFGQNCAAIPYFVFNAKEVTTMKCEVAELVNDSIGAKSRGMDGPEGSIHRLNLRIPDTGMYVQYTFADNANPVSYMPIHTFFGYRYISLTADNDMTIADVKSVPVTSITKEMEIGKIATGNDDINKLISNTWWSQLSNYLSVPTDCPQRNERLGWTADTQVFAETGSFFANTKEFFHKWLRDLRDTQDERGGYPSVAPLGQYGWEPCRFGWSDAGIIVPWTIWKQYGDQSIIDESWESMEKYINHIAQTKYDHVAIAEENGNYQWADWLSYEPLETCSGQAFGSNGPLPEAIEYWNYLSAAYWAIDASMMADMAKATGRDHSKYETMLQEAKAYLTENFLTKDGRFKTEILNTMQTPALFALKTGIVEGEAKEKMKQSLRENFAQHGDCLQTGFLGTSILMSTLTDNDMADIAYNLLFQRANPSWLYSIDNGATTIWERWNSYMIEHGMGPQGMNSFNHYAYGCVCEWLWKSAAGIASDPENPGFKHIIMQPIPDKRLGSVNAQYQSAIGEIKSEWHYDADDTWIWNFTIPQGATATITLPGETTSHDYAPGTYQITKQLGD